MNLFRRGHQCGVPAARSGSTIRRHAAGECTDDEFGAAVNTVIAFRAQFSDPLGMVQTRLRRIHQDLEIQGEPSQAVTQRLKKSPTIIDKLSREPGLDLSRMQDIGGCRIVVESLTHLGLIEDEIRSEWGENLHHVKDYIVEPRSSGYRAVHMIVKESGFQIEIQLRTQNMHNWAVLVEAFSGMSGENFKQDGSHFIQDFLRLKSEGDAREELGLPPIPGHLDMFSKLGEEVNAYLAASKEARKDQP